jgi:hypothetical protein
MREVCQYKGSKCVWVRVKKDRVRFRLEESALALAFSKGKNTIKIPRIRVSIIGRDAHRVLR